MKIRTCFFPAAVVVLFAGSCVAGEPIGLRDANAPRQLADYLREAALHNAGLKAAFERWKAAVEQVPQARALPDPRFTYGYFIREVETRVGPQRHMVGLSQMFPWFGKIEARTDAAAAAAKAARKRYEAAKLRVFFEVKEVFYEYSYLARAVEIARENLALIEHFEEVARAKYTAAAGGHPDLVRAQIELAKLEDRLNALEELRGPLVARLNAILNRASSLELPWPEREEFRSASIDRKKFVGLLKARNPELAALTYEMEGARSRVALAAKRKYPDVGVGVDWIATDRSSMSVSDSGKDPVILMFTMNLPVWRASYRAAEIEAKARLRMTSQKKRETENSLIAYGERVLYDFEDSDRKARLYGDVLRPKVEELIEASETAYKAGSVDFLSLLDAQRMLLEYELLAERATADRAQRLAELEMLAGTELAAERRETPVRKQGNETVE